jgi:hypothetical protein
MAEKRFAAADSKLGSGHLSVGICRFAAVAHSRIRMADEQHNISGRSIFARVICHQGFVLPAKPIPVMSDPFGHLTGLYGWNGHGQGGCAVGIVGSVEGQPVRRRLGAGPGKQIPSVARDTRRLVTELIKMARSDQ